MLRNAGEPTCELGTLKSLLTKRGTATVVPPRARFYPLPPSTAVAGLQLTDEAKRSFLCKTPLLSAFPWRGLLRPLRGRRGRRLQCSHLPGDGGCSLGCFLVSPVLKTSGGGSSPRSILHSKANRYWMYCFFRELAALLEVPTLRLVASSRHFLFLLT